MKTLLFVFGCLAFANALRKAYVGTRDRQGTCPPPSENPPRICVFDPDVNCVNDTQCPRGQKCCPEGCNGVCKATVPTNPVVHRGSCPAPSGLLGPCVVLPNSCGSDSDCGRREKCCPEGCGSVCKTAIRRRGRGNY